MLFQWHKPLAPFMPFAVSLSLLSFYGLVLLFSSLRTAIGCKLLSHAALYVLTTFLNRNINSLNMKFLCR